MPVGVLCVCVCFVWIWYNICFDYIICLSQFYQYMQMRTRKIHHFGWFKHANALVCDRQFRNDMHVYFPVNVDFANIAWILIESTRQNVSTSVPCDRGLLAGRQMGEQECTYSCATFSLILRICSCVCVCVQKPNTQNGINISMRARIQIMLELWFSTMSNGLNFKLFDKQNVWMCVLVVLHAYRMYVCVDGTVFVKCCGIKLEKTCQNGKRTRHE